MLCVISGANWDNGSNAGAWASNWNNNRTNSNNNVGLRADSIPPETRQRETGNEGDGFLLLAKSLCAPGFSSNSEHQRGFL